MDSTFTSVSEGFCISSPVLVAGLHHADYLDTVLIVLAPTVFLVTADASAAKWLAYDREVNGVTDRDLGIVGVGKEEEEKRELQIQVREEDNEHGKDVEQNEEQEQGKETDGQFGLGAVLNSIVTATMVLGCEFFALRYSSIFHSRC